MPGYTRAELTANLKVVPDREAEKAPQEQVAAAKRAAADSGLAHEAGPEATILAGDRAGVLDALRAVVEAALDAGAHAIEVTVEAERDARRF
jgi:uncharacterized protein YqgV (UPF0045/DUF77 family)